MTVKALIFKAFFFFPEIQIPPKKPFSTIWLLGRVFCAHAFLVVEVCAWPSLLEAVFTS